MRPQVAILSALLIIAGCRSAAPTAATPKTAGELLSLVDHQVHLEGRFRGPGKFADYIVVDGTQIYLPKPDSGGRAIVYGSIVAVDGTLRYQRYSETATMQDDQAQARPPDHFYVEEPKVHLIEAPLRPGVQER